MPNGITGSQEEKNYHCLACSWSAKVPTNAEERIQTAALKRTLVYIRHFCVSVPSTTVVCLLCYFVPVLLLSAGSVPEA